MRRSQPGHPACRGAEGPPRGGYPPIGGDPPDRGEVRVDNQPGRLSDRRIPGPDIGTGDVSMTRPTWNDAIRGLLLVRIGQELGTDSRLARAVHDAIDAMLAILGQ